MLFTAQSIQLWCQMGGDFLPSAHHATDSGVGLCLAWEGALFYNSHKGIVGSSDGSAWVHRTLVGFILFLSVFQNLRISSTLLWPRCCHRGLRPTQYHAATNATVRFLCACVCACAHARTHTRTRRSHWGGRIYCLLTGSLCQRNCFFMSLLKPPSQWDPS